MVTMALLLVGCGVVDRAMPAQSVSLRSVVAKNGAESIVESIAVNPSEVTLHGGDEIQLEVSGRFDQGETLALDRQQLRFETSNSKVIHVLSTGKAIALEEGQATIAVGYKTALTTVPVKVLKKPDSTCDSRNGYLSLVEPHLQSRCVGCHGANGQEAARQGFALRGPNPDPVGINENFQLARRKVDLADHSKSLLISKATNKIFHGGGAIFPPESSEIAGFLSWASVERACQAAEKVVSLELDPGTPTIESGSRRIIKLNARTGAGIVRDVTAKATWTVKSQDGRPLTADKGSLDSTPEGMALTLRTVGERWRVEAAFESRIATAEMLVVSRAGFEPKVTCPSFATFRKDISPLLRQKSCGPGCHYAGGVAAGAYQILADDLSCESAYENWIQARRRIQFASPERSFILLKPAGLTSHGGGSRLSTTGPEFAALQSWVSQESTCKGSNPNDLDHDVSVVCRRLLTMIRLAPTTPILRVGEFLTLIATGRYDDRSELPMARDAVTWSSSNEAILAVDPSGKLTALATGSARIKATSGAVATDVDVTVLEARTLIGLDLSPASQTVAKGQVARYTVKNLYSNGDVEPRTTPVDWLVRDPEIASVSGAGIVARNVGTTTIIATDFLCPACTNTVTLTVTPAIITGINISPNPVPLTVGLATKLSIVQNFSDGTQVPINVTANWVSSDPTIFSVDGLGNANGIKAGAATVTVTHTAFGKSADVFVAEAGECSSFNSFVTNVDPMLQSNCLSCHSSGQPGTISLVLRGSDQKLYNWSELKERVDTSVVAETSLLKRALRVAHPGSGSLASGSDNRIKLESWIQSEIACQISARSSNLARSSGKVLYSRLAALFPNAVSSGNDPKPLFFEDFDALRAAGSFRLIGQPERSLSPLAMNLWRQKVNQLCNSYITGGDTDMLFNWTPDLLLAGESVPNDTSVSVPLAAARRAWGYPYAANHAHIVAMQDFYRASKADGESEIAARKGLCVAVLVSPQFLLGNAGEDDVLRRLSLALAGRVPLAADYEAFRKAPDKSAYVRSYVQSIQTQASTREAYLEQMFDWHRIWLGLRDFYAHWWHISRPSVREEKNRATGVGGVAFALLPKATSGFDRAIGLDREIFSSLEHDFSESCQSGLDQAFDPRTGELIWQHFNPLVNQWETVGSWKKVGDKWEAINGQITIDASGATKETSLSDIRRPQRANINGKFLSKYTSGGLIGTPLEVFVEGQRRLIRRSPDGVEQKGYSTVRLWWSREPLKVCNTISRYLATCAYRPKDAAMLVTGALSPTWNALTASAPKLECCDNGGRDTFAHPTILDAFSCGVPNGDMIAKIGQADYQELAAFPKGYMNDTDPVDDSSLQGLAINVNDVISFRTDSDDRFTEVTSVIYRNSASPWAEDRAFGRLIDDLTQEPIRLLGDILTNNRDYRLLLTAPYTFGGPELDLYFRSQGYFLPLYPSGYMPGSDSTSLRTIRQADIQPIPIGWLKNSLGRMPDESIHAYDLRLGEIRPRTMSGIMTQMAFLAPVQNEGKVRSVSARIHERLLCGMPSEFIDRLDDQALQLHDSYISAKGDNGGQHLDRSKGCYACHVTLDPVASVYSKSFVFSQRQPGSSEARLANIFAFYGKTYGLRGNDDKAKGAFLGTEVTGISQLADVISRSKEFSTCVVKTAFEHLFGRKPVSSDLGLVQRVTNQFMGSALDYNYNKMIEELAASPEFLREE